MAKCSQMEFMKYNNFGLDTTSTGIGGHRRSQKDTISVRTNANIFVGIGGHFITLIEGLQQYLGGKGFINEVPYFKKIRNSSDYFTQYIFQVLI